MHKGSTRNDAEHSSKTYGPDDYDDRDALAAAYAACDGVLKATARQFDASYWTVRLYLIEYGIHEPTPQAERSLAARLEAMDADDVVGGRA